MERPTSDGHIAGPARLLDVNSRCQLLGKADVRRTERADRRPTNPLQCFAAKPVWGRTRDGDHRTADCIVSSRTTRLAATTKTSNRCSDRRAGRRSLKTNAQLTPDQGDYDVHHLTGYPSEEAFGCGARSRDSFHRPVIFCNARVGVGRLRSERPSRPVWRLPLWRPEPSLVPDPHRPCVHAWSLWDAVVPLGKGACPRRRLVRRWRRISDRPRPARRTSTSVWQELREHFGLFVGTACSAQRDCFVNHRCGSLVGLDVD
jgi:hypothetical protein